MTAAETPISVLVVESSSHTCDLLSSIINAHPRLTVAQCVASGEAALAILAKWQPDIILMGISLPELDGFATTRRIMETIPLPILICSSACAPGETSKTFEALEAGALAVVEKPTDPHNNRFSEIASRLVEALITMSEVRVVKRWPRSGGVSGKVKPSLNATHAAAGKGFRVIAIGASTGGPPALHTILQKLPGTAPPVLIVQHISAGFLTGLTEWLEASTGICCRIPAQHEPIAAGTAYFAPDGLHMGINRKNQIILSEAPPEQGLRPSVNFMFRSVAENFGQLAVGILLTGMGKDGAEELRRMREMGALTIAQNPHSCIVHGMPGEAIRLDGACKIMSPDEIASFLADQFRP
jgi:two-component system chemotaxis response regulator CheB